MRRLFLVVSCLKQLQSMNKPRGEGGRLEAGAHGLEFALPGAHAVGLAGRGLQTSQSAKFISKIFRNNKQQGTG